MRKILLGLVSVMLFALSVYTAIYGFSIGSLEVKSIPAIKEENMRLDNKIQTASNLRTKDYPQNVTLLESAYKKLMSEKESYEQLLKLGVDENGLPLNKIQEYEMEKIWVAMGNYAQKEGVDLKMDITSNNSVSKTYDLKFTATGGYIQITDFLYDVERDTTLVFKIENFKMVPGENTDNLSATFTCKDIKLNIADALGSSSKNNSDSEDKKEDSTTDNKSQTTNDTNTNANTSSSSAKSSNANSSTSTGTNTTSSSSSTNKSVNTSTNTSTNTSSSNTSTSTNTNRN